jgi:hypothetical protein
VTEESSNVLSNIFSELDQEDDECVGQSRYAMPTRSVYHAPTLSRPTARPQTFDRDFKGVGMFESSAPTRSHYDQPRRPLEGEKKVMKVPGAM